MAKKIELSIVVPCFNEEKRLQNRFDSAYRFFKNHFEAFEIILVNDGSKDDTLELLKNLSDKYSDVSFVTYQQNQGKGYALKSGVNQAKGEIIGIMDADFSINLDETVKFVNAISQGNDIVIGDRSNKEYQSKSKLGRERKLFGHVLAYINNFFLELGTIKDTQCGFKFFKAEVAKKLFANLSIYRWLWDVDILKAAQNANFKIVQLSVSWQQISGSKVKIYKDLLPVGFDMLRIYYKYLSSRTFMTFLLFGIGLIMLPYIINPESLVRRNGDYSDIVWPNYYFIKESIIKFHQLPLWNPTLFSGIPEIANPQSPLIYPPNILALILPIDLSIVILIILHLLIAGFYLFKLTKDIFYWSSSGIIITAFIFIFSPFLWGKIAVGHLSQSWAILLLSPIIYYGIKLFNKPQFFGVLPLAFFLSLQYLNYPTIWYFTVLFGMVVGCYLQIVKKQVVNLFYIFFVVLLSLLIILPIFLIQLQAGSYITRTSLSVNDLAIPIWSLKRFLGSIILPSNLTGDLETESWLYSSLATLILAVWGCCKLPNKWKLLSLGVGSTVILITFGNRLPIFKTFVEYVPGFSYLRVSTRDWFIFIALISFLAGWAVEQLKDWKKIVTVLVIADLLFFSAWRIWDVPKVMKFTINQNLVRLLKNNDGYRYYCTRRCLSARETLPRGVKTADGYHLLILKNYQEQISRAGGFPPTKYTGNIPAYEVADSQPSAEKLGKFAVKLVVSDNILLDQGFNKIDQSGKYILYENTLAKSRVRFEKITENTAEILQDTPNAIKIRTVGESDKLILSDSAYPGWEVWIDGIEKTLMLEDGWAKSVIVPAGIHQVEFVFRPFVHLKEVFI